MSLSEKELTEMAPECGHPWDRLACRATVEYWIAAIRTQIEESSGPLKDDLRKITS